jgi:hypothetical protein
MVDALHVVPFLLGLAAYGASWRSGGPAPDWRAFDSIARAPWQVVLVLTTLQTIIYVRWIRGLLARHGEAVRLSYSAIDKVTLGWLRWRLAVFAAIWAAGIVMMAAVAFQPRGVDLASQFVFFLVALNTFATGYRAMLQPIFFGSEEPATTARRYERSSLTPDNAALVKARLLALMERDKPFLDPEITLPGLAQTLEVPPAHLSRVLNETPGSELLRVHQPLPRRGGPAAPGRARGRGGEADHRGAPMRVQFPVHLQPRPQGPRRPDPVRLPPESGPLDIFQGRSRED